MNKNRDVIHLERESVVAVTMPVLITRLIEKFGSCPFWQKNPWSPLRLSVHMKQILSNGNASDRVKFLTFCRRVEYTIRAWYHLQFEDMMQLYALFNPLYGNKRLKQRNLHDNVEILEQNFLTDLFEILEKSNFKMVTDKEVANALSGQYLLNLPIDVDISKLDSDLFKRYFEKHPRLHLPKNYDKYLVFRRGFGTDQKTGRFYMEKLNTIIARAWSWFLNVTRLQGFCKRNDEFHKKSDHAGSEGEHEILVVERKRIENMDLSLKMLISDITIQEPTFDRVIVVYRLASTNPQEPDRGIYIKHFKNIPMADMEIVLPEKKNPSLTPTDWVKYIVTAVIGLSALVSSLERPKADFWVLKGIILAVISYIVNEYFTFQQNLAAYQYIITQSMYEKQLDSGTGTLLHLCDDMISQEVKEVIISFYILLREGKEHNVTTKELDQKCEQLMKDEFQEECNFDVDDAIKKLKKLGIITIDSSGRIQCETLESANSIIGHTTEERVLKAKRQPSGISESKAIAGEYPIFKEGKQHADLDPTVEF